MPCTDWGREPGDFDGPQQQKIDKLTRLLCESMGLLEDVSPELNHSCSAELMEWWEAHKKLDARRGGPAG